MVSISEVLIVMDLLKILGVCVLVAGLSGCRKKTDKTATEVREAGYEMTAEGWSNAIRDNDVAVLKKMVEGGFDHKSKDADGNSGLHLAAAAGSKEAAEYLLNRGHSVDETGGNGRTALMAAVLADKPEMVKWLLRQGADPKVRDAEGFIALMLASSEGKAASVEELAPYHREDLDSALLLAALVGEAAVIDVLTNYGASVYARMEDGRTPLMLAAENGHKKAVALLIDIGASRFATTESGDTAQSFAVAAGHTEIAEMIESGFVGDELAFESDEQVAAAMEEYVDQFAGETGEEEGLLAANDGDGSTNAPWNNPVPGQGEGAFGALPKSKDRAADGGAGGSAMGAAEGGIAGNPPAAQSGDSAKNALGGATGGGSVGEPGNQRGQRRFAVSRTPVSLEGAKIGKLLTNLSNQSEENRPMNETADRGAVQVPSASSPDPEMPLVMRHYRQRELPVEVQKVSGGVASLRLPGAESPEVEVRSGDTIPGSNLVVVRVFSRTEQGKLNNSQPMEVGIVEVEDAGSGKRREWIAGRSASGHDPVALVEDASTGQRYVAKPGQRFGSEDGREFVVSDVRPTQLVIEDTTTGEVRTLRLRGPKG